MHIHPTTLQLSRRLNLFLPIPGIIALATFLLTLSPGVYPGYSSALTAAAAGLISPSGADHPVFAWLLRFLASASAFSFPASLNLFSALCGALCAVVLYHFVANLILYFACETKDGSTIAAGGQSRVAPELSQEMALHNRRMLPLAVIGGLIAALLLTFMVPLWSVSNRAHPASFDLLLALASFDLLFMNGAGLRRSYSRILILALSGFLFTVGLFESAVFLLLLPFYIFFSGSAFYFSSRRKTVLSTFLLGCTLGLVCVLFAFFQNRTAPFPTGIRSLLFVFASNFASHHYHEIRTYFPQTGWLLLLFQTALPVLLLLFGTASVFGEKQRGRLPALILLTLSSIPNLLNLSFSTWCLLQSVELLPVFGCAVTAARR